MIKLLPIRTAARRLLAGVRSLRPLLIALALFGGLLAHPVAAQVDDDTPLLPDAVAEQDIEMRGRYARQWKQADGTMVVVFTGAFRLDAGKRAMTANNAVVWIESRRTEPENRRYYQVTVYLSERAEVREPGGTITEDNVLLVSNLRTYGRIVKFDDAHAPESMESSDFYQRAVEDRRRIEGGEPSMADGPSSDQEPPSGVEVSRPGDAAKTQRKPRLIRYVLPKGTQPATTHDGETVQVASGRVYFAQSGSPDSPVLEIQADSAVIFPAGRSAAIDVLAQGDLDRSERAASQPQSRAADEGAESDRRPERDESSPAGGMGNFVKAVYLEGDVILTLGDRVIRASRLYYDFERDRALILDAVLRADLPERGIPLYVRADQIRQLSEREFAANKAIVTASEFFSPHYHIGAERVYIRDATERDAAGRPAGKLAGTYEMHDATLNVNSAPILWWPYSKGTLEQSETLLRRFRTGYSRRFGAEIETAWYLFNLLGMQAPPGFDATLKLDYFSKRGPAVGINMDYEQPEYLGLMRNYYVNDQGRDNFGPIRDNQPDGTNRGRTLWRHRQFLPNDWELTLETGYVSDPGFLEEYEKNEWFNGKRQEHAIYLKRAKEVEAVTLLANWRMMDFETQTEHLPDLTYRRIGDVLDPLVLYHESRVGGVRFRPDDRNFFDSRRFTNDGLTNYTFRADGREEAELPLKLAGLNIVPFSTLRGSYWSGQPRDDGGLWRGLGVYGVRGGTYFSRVYDDINSDLLDLHRIRHVVQPYYAAWWSHSNADSDNITPFDEGIETVNDFYGGMVGVRQTWQTKRGGEGRQRSVDVLTLNLEAGWFGGEGVQGNERSNGWVNPIRPEDSRTQNYAAGELAWRASDTTTLMYDFNLNADDWSFDRQSISLAVERLPRLAYILGYRHAGDINLDLVGGGFNYKLNEKHITAMRAWYDTDRGRLGEVTVSYVRKLPRWYFSLDVEFNEVFDDVSIGITLWPEGIPEWTLGSKRNSRLGRGMGIRP